MKMCLPGSWGPGSLMQFIASNLVPGTLQGHFIETPCICLAKKSDSTYGLFRGEIYACIKYMLMCMCVDYN
jgi:hypothetical protein